MENTSQPETTSQDEDTATPALENLPVRIHVVLSQIELSLTELEELAEGSVLELEREKTGRVRLVSNGEVLGAGELVEVEGRLGVQIIHWKDD